MTDVAQLITNLKLSAAITRATPRHENSDIEATWMEEAAAELSRLSAPSFQARVAPWMLECFGPVVSADKLERGDRLLEEVLELLQSGDYPPERVAALTDYVYGRPKGEPDQEVGGVMVTLAAYCVAHGLDMHHAGETELARINAPEIIAKIRAKQAAKPKGAALPVAVGEDLSDDAKVVFGALFGLGTKTTLTHHLRESVPTARTFDALTELVAKGYLSCEPYNRFGGLVYRPLKDPRPAFKWLSANQAKGKFKLTEPVK